MELIRRVIFLIICIAGCNTADDNNECGRSSVSKSLVFGGTQATLGQWPWVARLAHKVNKNYLCGATIISKKHVLSAAHCILEIGSPEAISAYSIRILVGGHDIKNVFEWTHRDVTRITLHPDWQKEENRYDADLSILEMDEPLVFSERIRRICLPQLSTEEFIKTGSVTGYGTTEKGVTSQFPQHIAIPTIKLSTCFLKFPTYSAFMSERMFCAGEEGKIACKGDSGSGFVAQDSQNVWTIYGIVSSAYIDDQTVCNSSAPTAFTSVPQFSRWIQDIVSTPSRCAHPVKLGTGNKYETKYFFDPHSQECKQFLYYGNGGNENRFDSKSDCENICKSRGSHSNLETKADISCTLPNSSRTSTCVQLKQCETFQSENNKYSGRPPPDVVTNIRAHICPGSTLICCPDGAQGGESGSQLIRSNKVIPELVGHRSLNLINERNCGVASSYRIVGGVNANLNELPWMALLKYKDRLSSKTRFGCGGTLISRRYVLAAAHCIFSDLIEVRLGEHTLSTVQDCDEENYCAPPVQDIRIQRKIKHPQYGERNILHDIALLRLEREANIEPRNVRTVCLPTEVDATLENIKILKQDFTIAGWGLLGNGSQENSDVLQKADIPYVEQDDCVRQFKTQRITVHPTYLCAGGHKKVDPCRGDTGGPITNYATVNGKLRVIIYGVSSGGVECEQHEAIYPGIYMNVEHYLKWILDNLEP